MSSFETIGLHFWVTTFIQGLHLSDYHVIPFHIGHTQGSTIVLLWDFYPQSAYPIMKNELNKVNTIGA
jgi:hypothetical protein